MGGHYMPPPPPDGVILGPPSSARVNVLCRVLNHWTRRVGLTWKPRFFLWPCLPTGQLEQVDCRAECSERSAALDLRSETSAPPNLCNGCMSYIIFGISIVNRISASKQCQYDYWLHRLFSANTDSIFAVNSSTAVSLSSPVAVLQQQQLRQCIRRGPVHRADGRLRTRPHTQTDTS